MNIFKKFKLWTNGMQQYFFKGNITIGKKVKFYQKLRLNGNGTIEIGDNSFFGYGIGGRFYGGSCEIQARSKDSVIKIGKNVAVNNNMFFCANKSIVVEDDVLIGERVTIMDHNGHGVYPDRRRNSAGTAKEVIIKRNVWIGSNVTILPGTIIGDNSVVGAGSVVKGVFPDNVVIQGNPAVVVKKIKTENYQSLNRVV